MASRDSERRRLFFMGVLDMFAGILILVICAFLFKFEAFHSSMGAKVFPPLLFLSGYFFYRAYKRLRRMLHVPEQNQTEHNA